MSQDKDTPWSAPVTETGLFQQCKFTQNKLGITCLVTQETVSCGLSGDCSRGHRPHSGDTPAVKAKGVAQLLLVSVFLMGVDTIKWSVYTNYPENDGSRSNGKKMTLSHT